MRARSPAHRRPSGVWFRPEGRLFLCGRSRTRHDRAKTDDIDPGFFDGDVWPELAARVPAFESIRVVNAWAGFRLQHARP